MTDRLTIVLAQLNPTVGAVSANLAKARTAYDEVKAKGVDLVLYSELFLSGYPPEDLVLRPSFVETCKSAAEDLARETKDGPAILIGLPWRDGAKLYNAVALLKDGVIETLR
ncbi:MAG: nitrilase-related carbon-nitrogen hydrolase, partial [Parvibaculaceae bacterium]